MEHNFEIREISPDEEASTACLLAECLLTNTSYKYIVRGVDQARREDLVWFFRFRLRISRALGGVTLGLFENGKAISTATYGPIAAQDPPYHVLINCGILFWPFMLGFPSLFRALKLGKQMANASYNAHGKTDWEIMMVATSPPHQGRGLGSQVLKAALDRIRLAQRGDKTAVGLTTQLEKNVRLYTKLGFAVTAEHDLFAGTPVGFHTWIMQQDL